MPPQPLIMVAPTGARRGPADHPALPITLEQTLAEARACWTAGAHALHLHVRDGAGRHSLDPGLYREALAALADSLPALQVQITTEAAGRYDVAAQGATLAALRPAWASIAVREMARDPTQAARIYAAAQAQGTRLQHILFDAADLAQLAAWRDDGTVPEPREVILVFGAYAPQVDATPDQVVPRLAALHGALPQIRWMACAFGRQEQTVLREAARLGGDVRLGFENNIHHPDGRPLDSTAQSVTLFRSALQDPP